VHHWKEHEMLVWKEHGHFELSFYLNAISALEEHGNTHNPVCIYACREFKQIGTFSIIPFILDSDFHILLVLFT
jgi:hypothetical protein